MQPHRHARPGVGRSCNRALAAARGEYVCVLSLDDLLLPDCISSKISLLDNDENMMLAANTSVVEIDEDGQIINEMFETPLHGKQYSEAAEMLEHEYEHIGTFFMQGVVFRRKIFDAVGGYDVDQTGDDLIIRTKIWQYMLRHQELTFALLATPGFAYRKHGQNIHHNVFRQLRTVLEWRDGYFPNRPPPKLFGAWAQHLFNKCIAEQRHAELQEALNYSPEIRAAYDAYRSTWKYRRRAVKHFVRRKLGIGRT